ncbi:lysyl endopeptidase [Dysgonomonadaceae bacterium PH5-43]|nr:lysyl endopeptidase [Dysgonomonadaceae bacterium PH5-43]
MNRYLALIICVFLWSGVTFGQVSYGGKPLMAKNNSILRSDIEALSFLEMPSFDLDSVFASDGIGRDEIRTGFPFAYKFHTNIKRGVDGTETILQGGTKVWRVGIKSEGAHSINLLFTEFEIPEGGKLFVYNADGSYIIGSFDHRNNSEQKTLPLRPVAGDAIIVEYSEPEDVEFEGRLTIGEVNHDYRDILNSEYLRKEPDADHASNYLCMPDALCEDVDETLIRATVLIMINGNIACSGVLLNNTNNDEKPYLLTAVHCFHSTNPPVFPKEYEFYVGRAETVITFFNYNRQECGSKMKATEQLSTAMAYPRVILENKDIALLELQEKPPLYTNHYYAGWNIDQTLNSYPYINLHHPSAAVTKYGLYNKTLNMGSYPGSFFDNYSHWIVSGWDVGSTYGGSSGSPLFNSDNLVVGGLTGGSSNCTNTSPNGNSDYFFALKAGWETEDETNQLKTYLDPLDLGATHLSGLDPNKEKPLHRISNVALNTSDTLSVAIYEDDINEGFVFGNSSLPIYEFAEAFEIDTTSILQGVFVFVPKMPYSYFSEVKINVYSGDEYPEDIIASQILNPQYLNYSNVDSIFYYASVKTSSVATEHFVQFDDVVYLNKKFFIGYEVANSTNSKFVVYNTTSLEDKINTAWIKDEKGNWITANEYNLYPIKTSLAINALIQHNDNPVDIIDIVDNKTKNNITYNKQNNTLSFPRTTTEGKLEIYSINGQLVYKQILNTGQESALLKSNLERAVYIVRIITNNEVYSEKILY